MGGVPDQAQYMRLQEETAAMRAKAQQERLSSGEYEMRNGVLVRKGITVSNNSHFFSHV